MKNKRIIIILSFVLFFALLLILCSNIFALKSVNIELSDNKSITAEQQAEICTQSCFKYNQSIFFINKNKITQQLEKQYSNLMIESIETIFPNKLVIHAKERQEVFYVKIANNSFASFDQTFKCINMYSTQPNLTQVTGVNAENAIVGERLTDVSSVNIATQTYYSFYMAYYEVSDFLRFVKRVEINESQINLITKISGEVGLAIEIENPNINLTNKIVYALSAYNALSVDQKSHGKIVVIENIENSEKYIVTYQP